MSNTTLSNSMSSKKPNSRRLRGYAGAIGLFLSIAALGTACGTSAPTATAPPPPTTVTAPPTAEAPASAPASSIAASPGAVVVTVAESSIGKVLVNTSGLTLYGFTNDKPTATSTCFGACAKAWPPLLVGENDQAAPEVNAGIISTVIRTDGQRQFVVGSYPVYTYIGDTKPGDLTGNGLGGVWFPIAPDGSLITTGATPASGSESASATASDAATEAASEPVSEPTDDPAYPAPTQAAADSPVGSGSTGLGDVLTNKDGLTLYGFTDDTPEKSSCAGGCAQAWPPLTVPSADLPSGLDSAQYSVGTRDDGTFQLKNGKWWLYTYTGDAAAGETNGQGSGGKWFVVGTDGKLIKS